MIKKTIKKIINDRKTGRDVDIYDDDVMIVSYPKSGNTWMRFLLGNILHDDYNFSNMEDLIPDIYVLNNKKLKEFNRPRIMKSHEYFIPTYKKVIYIVRDPRSVVVSYFHYQKKFNKISHDMAFSEYFKLFIDGKLDPFGNWEENIKSWICVKKNKENNLLLLKYEDLKINPLLEIKKVLSFLELSVSNAKISNAIQKSSFKKMKKNEKDNIKNTIVLNNSDKNIAFVRAGKTDEWKDYFSQTEIEIIFSKFGSTMEQLGYK